MLYVKNVHARPHRVGRLLWRPGQVHPINDHWLNKSVMRALVGKGWFIVSDGPFTKPVIDKKPDKVSNKAEAPGLQNAAQEAKPIPVNSDSHGPVNVAALNTGDLILDPVPREDPEPEEVIETVEESQDESSTDEAPQDEMPEEVPHTEESLKEMPFRELRELGQTMDVSARAKSDLVAKILEAQNSNGD